MQEYYMRLALDEAHQALERGDFPVGCVITDASGVICAGQRFNSREKNELNHAEIMALRKLYEKHSERISGELTIYSTMEPCLMCYSTLILNNIKTIVYAYEDVMGGGCNVALDTLKPLYSSKKISIVSGVLRNQSIALFQEFFKRDRNGYWKESLLATYTLQQKIEDQ